MLYNSLPFDEHWDTINSKHWATCAWISGSHIRVSLSLYSRRRFFRFIIIFKILNNLGCPRQLFGIFTLRSTLRNRELRDKTGLHLPEVKCKIGQAIFKYTGAKDWNSLPIYIREITFINIFKQILFTYLFDNDVNSYVCSL